MAHASSSASYKPSDEPSPRATNASDLLRDQTYTLWSPSQQHQHGVATAAVTLPPSKEPQVIGTSSTLGGTGHLTQQQRTWCQQRIQQQQQHQQLQLERQKGSQHYTSATAATAAASAPESQLHNQHPYYQQPQPACTQEPYQEHPQQPVHHQQQQQQQPCPPGEHWAPHPYTYGQPAKPQHQQQQQQWGPPPPQGATATSDSQPAVNDDKDCSSTILGVHMPAGGWFRKCRGCGTMTVHEIVCSSAHVPFCRACQARTAEMQACHTDEGLWQSLMYVHNAWSAAGV